MHHRTARRDYACVCSVDFLVRLDCERQVVQAWRIEEELLLLERLPQADRSRPGSREAEIVDRLATLSLDDERRFETQRAEDRRVERERALDFSTYEIDVTEPDQHPDADDSRA